jgi:hypothetical protein
LEGIISPSEDGESANNSLSGVGHGEGDGESIIDFQEGRPLDPVDDEGDWPGEDIPDLARSSGASSKGRTGVCGDASALEVG